MITFALILSDSMSRFLNTKAESEQKDMEEGSNSHWWHSNLGLRFLSLAWTCILNDTTWNPQSMKKNMLGTHTAFRGDLYKTWAATMYDQGGMWLWSCSKCLTSHCLRLKLLWFWTTDSVKCWAHKHLLTIVTSNIYFLSYQPCCFKEWYSNCIMTPAPAIVP